MPSARRDVGRSSQPSRGHFPPAHAARSTHAQPRSQHCADRSPLCLLARSVGRCVDGDISAIDPCPRASERPAIQRAPADVWARRERIADLPCSGSMRLGMAPGRPTAGRSRASSGGEENPHRPCDPFGRRVPSGHGQHRCVTRRLPWLVGTLDPTRHRKPPAGFVRRTCAPPGNPSPSGRPRPS